MPSIRSALLAREALLFGSTQILGLLVAKKYLANISQLSTPASFSFTLTDFILMPVFFVLFIWMMTKKNRASRIFFRIFFALVILGGSLIIFSALMSEVLAMAVSILLVFLLFKLHNVLVHNIAVVLATAGIGLVFGLSITPLVAVGILVVFSFYDIFAVYVSKHMVKMAQGMMHSGAIFGFIVPQKRSGHREKISKVKPGDQFMILGSGDIVLPLILVTSLVRFSIAQASLVAFSSLLGLLLTHALFVSQPKRRAMAALPPIAMMSIMGYLVALVFGL